MTREEAIHFATCLKNNWTINFDDMEEFCDMAIETLAEAVQGEWMNVGVLTVRCSNCKSEFHELEAMNFCPNCGAKMKGGDSK